MIDKISNKTIVAIVCVTVAFVFLAAFTFGGKGSAGGITQEYESTLFNDDNIIEINLEIDEEDWENLLKNAVSEEYYSADVTVNGETYAKAGIRAKGNTSLFMVASSDSDRYSFKIKFDEYIDGQKCDGLSELILNNNYADATMMKEAVVYDMFQFLDADAPLYNYARISVNGEYWGCYLAVESVEEEFCQRNYGNDIGKLYKPDSMEMGGGRGNMKDRNMDDVRKMMGEDKDSDSEKSTDKDSKSDNDKDSKMDSNKDSKSDGFGGMPDMSQMPDMPNGEKPDMSQMPDMPDGEKPDMSQFPDMSNGEKPDMSQMPGGNMPGMPGGGSGASLDYTDDDLDSYSSIWNGAVFESSKSDQRRVVEALKAVCSENADAETLEKYLDVDNILKYMAVNTFVVNLDGLTGNMSHNYYLYENNGQLNIIPWDYNLAFGGFASGDASSMINFPIDTPFSQNITEEDRQLFYALLNNEEYKQTYYKYLEELCTEYVEGGKLSETLTRIHAQIDDAIKDDPTSFYDYSDYEAAGEMFEKVLQLRAESILGQFDGSIPKTWAAQEEDSSALIDCKGIDLKVMGSQGGGHDQGGNHFPGGDNSQDSDRNQDGNSNQDIEQSPGDGQQKPQN